MPDASQDSQGMIKLSSWTEGLLARLDMLEKSHENSRSEKIEVSEAATFFGFLYEKLRSAIEFTEEHLFRRAAIQRILKRRLSINPPGDGEGENVIRELLWGRYFPKGALTQGDVEKVQKIIDTYLTLYELAIHAHALKKSPASFDYIVSFMACEIEEALHIRSAEKRLTNLYYLYQVTKNKVHIEGTEDEVKGQYYYVACETALLKNDVPFIRYHLLTLYYGRLHELTKEELEEVARTLKSRIREIELILKNPYHDRLTRFVRKQLPPFLILFSLIKDEGKKAKEILTSESSLKEKVAQICEEKYKETSQKLKTAGLRSIIYIFITKMLFILIFEIPISQVLYNAIPWFSVSVNGLVPPVLMSMIVTLINPPSAANTKRIQEIMVYIIDADDTYEKAAILNIRKKNRIRRPLLMWIFSVFYFVITGLVFVSLWVFLSILEFHFVSKVIFIFFLSVVTFFGYRIRQIAKEYQMESSDSLFTPIIDMISLPILSAGKILSNELAKINVFMVVFDVLIEAPFKLIVEVIEEWIRFARQRKDEIV